MKKFKVKFKSHMGGHPNDVIIEAEDYDEAVKLGEQFESLFGHKIINIWPFVFDIRAYIATSQNGEKTMDSPGTFGINQERFAALQKRKQLESANEVKADAPSA